MTVSNHRYPTLNPAFEKRPRSRSLSVSRATQTREELEQIREMRNVKFTVECADENEELMKDNKAPIVNVHLQESDDKDL